MSEIPYYFETPVPKFFRENGWFKNPSTRLFISWGFERSSQIGRTIFHDGKNIILKPYQFIFGRRACADELGLSESEVRNQVNNLVNAGFLKNATNSTTKRYSVYEWITTAFCKNQNQVNNQVTTKWRPSNDHNIKNKEYKTKESLPPNPPSKPNIPIGETEDLPSKIANPGKASFPKPKIEKIEIYPGVKLTQAEIDACIAVKGSYENVKIAVEFIMRCPNRKYKITNWPETVARWEIKNSMVPKVKENEQMAKRLEELYKPDKPGWACEIWKDPKKDQRGILFFNTSSAGFADTQFIPLIDPDFRDKASKVIREKKMQKCWL